MSFCLILSFSIYCNSRSFLKPSVSESDFDNYDSNLQIYLSLSNNKLCNFFISKFFLSNSFYISSLIDFLFNYLLINL